MDHSCGSRWSGHRISHVRLQCHTCHGCQARKALSDPRHVCGASNSIHNHDRCTVHITDLVQPMHRRGHRRDRCHGGSNRCQLEAVHRAIRIVGAHPSAHRCMHCGRVFSRYPTSTQSAAIELKNDLTMHERMRCTTSDFTQLLYTNITALSCLIIPVLTHYVFHSFIHSLDPKAISIWNLAAWHTFSKCNGDITLRKLVCGGCAPPLMILCVVLSRYIGVYSPSVVSGKQVIQYEGNVTALSKQVLTNFNSTLQSYRAASVANSIPQLPNSTWTALNKTVHGITIIDLNKAQTS